MVAQAESAPETTQTVVEGAPLPDATEAQAREPEYVPLESLHPHPRNYRSHPDDQIAHIMHSIRQFGLYRNIVVAEDYTILAGHGVVIAAGKMGFATVPVVRLPLSPEHPLALKLLAGDNEVQHLGEVDDRRLTELLKEIQETALDGLLGTGFDEMMLANLLMVTRPASEIANYDEAADWVGMPGYEAGGAAAYKIVVHVMDEATALQLMAFLKCRKRNGNGHTWSVTWPDQERDDSSSLLLEHDAIIVAGLAGEESGSEEEEDYGNGPVDAQDEGEGEDDMIPADSGDFQEGEIGE